MRQSTIQSEEPAATAFPANHLAGETSPYLLQHAHNPVDWHPWGEEALKLAREQNKLIFLSIGYAACHWCHVMERESFMDPEIAKILNEHFISIKVDREERPDVDEIYMTAVQLMTGSGGWPLNVFLTPELKPFFGGTYFPPEDNYGRPAFRTVLLRVAELWRDAPEDLLGGAERVVEAIKAHTAGEFAGSSNARFDESILTEAAAALAKTFDAEWGGFSPEPKFPPSSAIALLLRQYHHTGDSELLKMATITLDRMAQGGLYDQLGGGFHRYSTDARWLVPHFEKMLYDNALLARVYLEAWQATHKELYRRVARETLDYVLRDMTDPGGGFHSSEDADSEGEEGKFYVWRLAELSDVLGPEDGGFFGLHYGVTVPGDFEGSNILHVPRPAVKSAADQADEESLEARLAPLRDKLLARRNERVRPGKDDKVLTAWNGMMISALARGYQVLGDERYLQAAEKAADFILTELVRDGALLRTWRNTGGAPGEDKAKLPAYLDDYAQMIFALTDLYEATFELERLEEADRLAARMIEEFWDEEHGGFFNTSAAHKNLLTRTKSTFDGPELSGNSVAVFALLRLAILLDQADYRQKAELTLNKLSDELHRRPSAMMNMLCAADFFLHAPREIAIAGKLDDAGTRLLLEHIHHRYLPNKVLALFNPGEAQARNMIERRIPLLKGKVLLDGKTTVYVCRNFACQQPVNELSALAKILDK